MEIEAKENSIEIPDKVSKIEIKPAVIVGEVFTALLHDINVYDFTIEDDKIIVESNGSIPLSDKAKTLIEVFQNLHPECEILFY